MHALRTRLTPLLVTLVGLLAPRGAAQDDPDIDLWTPFAGHPGLAGRMMDMAYTGDGALIVAYVEHVPGPGDDRVVILRREPSGGAFQQISDHAYGFEHALELSLAVPGRHTGDPHRDKVYVAVHFATDVGTGTDWEWAALISGRYDQKWKNPGRLAVAADVGQPSASWRAWSPSVAVVPAAPQDFSHHAAVLAFAFPQPAGTGIVRATSVDLGRNLQPSVHVAGPNAGGVTGLGQLDLSLGSYASPAAASDDRNAYLALAFQDDDRDVVHVLGASPASPGSFHAHSTPQIDGRRELAPRLACDGGPVQSAPVSDHPTFTVQPRVAVTRDGLWPTRESHGYTTRDWNKSGQPDGGYVNVDP